MPIDDVQPGDEIVGPCAAEAAADYIGLRSADIVMDDPETAERLHKMAADVRAVCKRLRDAEKVLDELMIRWSPAFNRYISYQPLSEAMESLDSDRVEID